jgi:hypothetical protein
MEQEELELIQKLQNTQMLQKNAYQELENALGNEAEAPPAKGSRPDTKQKGRAAGRGKV